jgi:hypothetical protein
MTGESGRAESSFDCRAKVEGLVLFVGEWIGLGACACICEDTLFEEDNSGCDDGL